MVDVVAGLVHCILTVHCDVNKILMEIENTVLVLTHHSQQDESKFELSPLPNLSSPSVNTEIQWNILLTSYGHQDIQSRHYGWECT